MATITIPCEVGDIIYYPTKTFPLPIRPMVTQIRITQYGMIIDAVNNRTGEEFHFPEIDFGKKVFFGEEGKKESFEVAKRLHLNQN